MNNWFQTEEALRIFRDSGEWLTERVHAGSVSCIVTIMGPFFCRRAIIQGGLAWEDKNYKDSDLQEALRQLKAISERYHCVYTEIRNFGDYDFCRPVFEKEGFCYQPHYDIHLPVDEEQRMFDRLHESKQRALRRLREEGHTWREAETVEDVKDFYRDLRKLYRTKVKRPLPSLRFFLTAWQCKVPILVTIYQGRITGGVLLPRLNEVAYEWYICGNTLGTWAMMAWSAQHGVKTLDLVGGGEPGVPYGVRDFKLQMGGELKEYGRFIHIRRPRLYELGSKIIRWMSKKL